MTEAHTGIRHLRVVLDTTLNWATLAYGIYSVAVRSVRYEDEAEIAVGGQLVLIALLGFLWGGHRRALGSALILAGLAAPVMFFATAPLYWDDVWVLQGEAFWTAMAIGGAVGVPLVVLGGLVLSRVRQPMRRDDSWWFGPVRWVVLVGLWIVVVAFQAGNWDEGVPLVYAGTALVLFGLFSALPRLLGMTRRGLGVLLTALGGAALAVIAVAMAFVGGHMSTDEALVGVVPALIVAVVGVLLAGTGRLRPGRSVGGRRPE